MRSVAPCDLVDDLPMIVNAVLWEVGRTAELRVVGNRSKREPQVVGDVACKGSGKPRKRGSNGCIILGNARLVEALETESRVVQPARIENVCPGNIRQLCDVISEA